MTLAQHVFAAFPPDATITADQLAQIVPLSSSTLPRILRALQREGRIERLSPGVYRQAFRDRVWRWDDADPLTKSETL